MLSSISNLAKAHPMATKMTATVGIGITLWEIWNFAVYKTLEEPQATRFDNSTKGFSNLKEAYLQDQKEAKKENSSCTTNYILSIPAITFFLLNHYTKVGGYLAVLVPPATTVAALYFNLKK